MYLAEHADRSDMKVWLSESETERFLAQPDATPQRIAFGLGLRCGLRTAEIVAVAPDDVVSGPAGDMLRVRPEVGKGGKRRSTPIPETLAATIETVADVRDEPTDAPLVDVSTRTLQRWTKRAAEELAQDDEQRGDGDPEGWRELTPHDFRRTWATLLAGAESIDPLLVCQWGGWEDIETFLEHYRGSYSPDAQRRARDGVEWL